MRNAEPDALLSLKYEQAERIVVGAVRRQTNVIQLELQHLIWCLNAYADGGGEEGLIKLYVRRYQPVACWMEVLSLMESEPVRNTSTRLSFAERGAKRTE